MGIYGLTYSLYHPGGDRKNLKIRYSCGGNSMLQSKTAILVTFTKFYQLLLNISDNQLDINIYLMLSLEQ